MLLQYYTGYRLHEVSDKIRRNVLQLSFTLVYGLQFLLVLAVLKLIADEYELVVVVPAVLLGVDSGLQLLSRGSSSSPRAAASCQLEALFLEHIERLLNEGVLEEESRGVAVSDTVVRITAFVQRLPKYVTAKGHSATHQDAGELSELDVRQPISAKSETSSVTDGDVSWSRTLGTAT